MESKSSTLSQGLSADLGMPEEVARLATALRLWEPALDLATIDDDTRVYEPDGTLYALCLSEQTTLSVQHRERVARRGDLIVLPQGFAIDAEPGLVALGVRHEGRPPRHFRERFFQVHGYDHFADAPDIAPDPDGWRTLLPPLDVRYRLVYAAASLEGGKSGRNASAVTQLDAHLLVVYAGVAEIVVEGGGHHGLPAPHAFLIGPGASYSLLGTATIGRAVLGLEWVHDSR